MNTTEYLSKWAISYKDDIINNIMPFWMKYGLDREHGGVYTCVNRDGSLMDTTKSVWFQGRFGFIAAYAYNNIEKNPQWLAASKSCIDFIEAHCFDTDGHMFFEVTEDGKPLRKRRYVFSEGFAAIAMAEYALATGEKEYAQYVSNLAPTFKPIFDNLDKISEADLKIIEKVLTSWGDSHLSGITKEKPDLIPLTKKD